MKLPLGLAGFAVLLTSLTLACGRTPGLPADAANNGSETLRAPFDRESPSALPATNVAIKLREGTAVTIRLQDDVSSATAHVGDSFKGTLDDTIVVQGQTVIASGALVGGRVLAAKSAGQGAGPGYLRIALTSLTADGRTIPIQTSSVFAKGGSHEKSGGAANNSFVPEKKEVLFEAGRRLTFRLAQGLDLP